MKLIHVYATYLARLISGDRGTMKDKISSVGLKVYPASFATHNHLTRVWYISNIPVDNTYNFTVAVRDEMFKLYPEVKVKVLVDGYLNNINIRTEVFKRNMKSVGGLTEQYMAMYNSLNPAQKAVGYNELLPNGSRIKVDKETVNRHKQNWETYSYVNSQVENGNKFSSASIFIMASAPDKKTMDNFQRNIVDYLDTLGVKFKQLTKELSKYLENSCPAKPSEENVFNGLLLSPENIVSQLPTDTIGLISSKGILLGLDPRNNLPVYQDIYGNTSAQVTMITGRAGSGKTMISQAIAIGHFALGTHGSMIDIKGGEGAKLIAKVGGKEIGMGDENSPYFNTMRLDDIVGLSLNPTQMYKDAVSSTVATLTIMTNLLSTEGNPSDLNNILQEAVEKTYTNNQVFCGSEKSYLKSKSLKPYDVLNYVKINSSSPSYTEEMKDICKLVIRRCSLYLDPQGQYSASFKNELTVADILNSHFNVYNFNLLTETSIDILHSVKIQQAISLETKKTAIRNASKKYTFITFEELQICIEMKTLIDYISKVVSLSRSQGVFVYLLGNVVSTFLHPNFSRIKSNITSKIVGKVDTADIRLLVKEFDCNPISKELYAIQDEDSDLEDKWKYAFAYLSDTGNGIIKGMVKACIPPKLEEVLRTRHLGNAYEE